MFINTQSAGTEIKAAASEDATNESKFLKINIILFKSINLI